MRDLKGAVVVKLPDAAAAHGAAVDAAGNIYLAQLSGIVRKDVSPASWAPTLRDAAEFIFEGSTASSRRRGEISHYVTFRRSRC